MYSISLLKAETASSIANLLSGYVADKEKFDEAWIAVLRNQFHDIIPGSSITEVYKDSAKEYENIASIASSQFDGAIDLLAEGIKIAKPERGTILGVLVTGAYNYSMASNYNRIPRPPVIMIEDGKARVGIKRETFDDIIRLDQ